MPQLSKKDLAREYEHFRFGSGGLGNFVHEKMDDEVFHQLRRLDQNPLTKVQLNQLLVLSNAGSMSDGFFKYYWLEKPEHPYDVTRLPYYTDSMTRGSDQNVQSHDHLRWGLYRLYVDGLLYFGNVAAAFRALRSKTIEELTAFYKQKRFDTSAISQRGPALPLEEISKDDRYLIAENACKTFGDIPEESEAARNLLLDGLKKHRGPITFRQLLEGVAENDSNREQLLLSYDDVLDATLSSEEELNRRFDEQFNKFQTSRAKATKNTALYLSMVNDLDVYVATSMRKRQNFRDMAEACEKDFWRSPTQGFPPALL